MISKQRKAYLKTWRKENPDYQRAWDKAHPGYGKQRFENPIHRRKVRCAHLRRVYGITLTDYMEMAKKQKNKCLICNKKKKLAVDHDHETGVVRGLLCINCNAFLCKFENVKTRNKILKYLGVK